MTNENSRTAPGSARRATPGRVVGRGCTPGGILRAGFTLIEVLASMAVLVILILALTRMFMEATSITKRGSSALMRNSTAETAMETLLQDAEGMVVSDRLACYVKADVTDPKGFEFDDVWFISTSGDQDDDLPYEYFHYFVATNIWTNALGASYLRFDLMKERMIFAVGDAGDSYGANLQFYALATNTAQWWQKGSNFPSTVWDRQVLADNVVRFDIYCTGWDGKGWMGGFSGVHEFDSTRGPNGLWPTNVPPAAFDIYLQVSSPDTALESGMALAAGLPATDPVVVKAREMMVRESSSVFGRAVPLIGAARYNTVAIYGTNNTAYYED